MVIFMRALHTSDWHIGRVFHEYQTLDALATVLDAVASLVAKRHIDVVLVAGDVYDVANPSAEAVKVFQQATLGILQAGAQVVMTSGNHDSAPRLGVIGAFSAASGLHVLTEVSQVGTPVELFDQHGPVDIFAVPYLQPALVRHLDWMPTGASSQREVVGAAMGQVRAAINQRRSTGRRSVVLAHTFAAGSPDEPFAERRITKPTAGGVDAVPVELFADIDYVALGHIHTRVQLTPTVRYCGAALHYSFKEAGAPRGGWVVDLDETGLANVEWVDFPVPRPLAQISGTLAHLLSDPGLDDLSDHFIRAVYTDPTRQIEPMRQLKARFPWCAEVVHQPVGQMLDNQASFRSRLENQTDRGVVASFLDYVRGDGLSADEAPLIDDVIAATQAERVAK